MLLSFHGKQELKDFYVQRITEHYEMDEIIKGAYWENGKGCAIGCLIHSSDYASFPTLLGWPEWFARLIDTIFENLPNHLAKEFPKKLVEAVPVGRDLEPVKWRFCSFLMQENLDRVGQLAISDELKSKVRDAIVQCKKLHENALTTEQWNDSAAAEAARSARSAVWSARSAARSAAEAVAAAWSTRSAAWSTAEAAAEAAVSAAWSTAWSTAAAEAWSAAYGKYAKKILEILKTA